MLRQLRNSRLLFSRPRRHALIAGVGIVTAGGLFATYGSRPIYGDADKDEEESKSKPKIEVDPALRGPLFSNFKLEVKKDLGFNAEVVATSAEIEHGTSRLDAAMMAANNPCEDALSGGHAPFSPTLGFTLVGVYDGHNGRDMASDLEKRLPDVVVSKLADLYSQHAKLSSTGYGSLTDRNPGEPPDPVPPGEEIDDAIRQAFLEFDDLHVHGCAQAVLGLDTAAYRALSGGIAAPLFEGKPNNRMSRSDALNCLRNAYSGSCALMGIYNSSERSLRVALTGDSRAVLGRRVRTPNGAEHVYETHHLTTDQNASNPSEAARLSALHPDEPELLKNKRVLGWGPARAFGDGSMKWSMEIQRMLHERYLGDRPREGVCKTPPYFTAEPVITTFEGVRRGDFAVFASDGLWDCLGSEEVVGLVGKWLEKNGIKERVDGREVMLPPKLPQTINATVSNGELQASFFRNGKQAVVETCLPSELPVAYPEDHKDTTVMYRYWRTEKKFICAPEDGDNAAVHLIRNALGGADRDLSEALLKVKGPRGRRFRDDITVAVVFFD